MEIFWRVELSDESERFPTCSTHGYHMPTKYEDQRTTLNRSPSSKSMIFRFSIPPGDWAVGGTWSWKIQKNIFFKSLEKIDIPAYSVFCMGPIRCGVTTKQKSSKKFQNFGYLSEGFAFLRSIYICYIYPPVIYTPGGYI